MSLGIDTTATETLCLVPEREILPRETPRRRAPKRHANRRFYGSYLSNQGDKNEGKLGSWPPKRLRVISEDHIDFPQDYSLNQFLLIECNATNCFVEQSHLTKGTDQRCKNRPITNLTLRGSEDTLFVTTTGPCGKELRTQRDITKDEIFLEYRARVLTEAQVKRKKNYKYVFVLRKKHFRERLFLDALDEKWGKGRFVNHDCNPNSRM